MFGDRKPKRNPRYTFFGGGFVCCLAGLRAPTAGARYAPAPSNFRLLLGSHVAFARGSPMRHTCRMRNRGADHSASYAAYHCANRACNHPASNCTHTRAGQAFSRCSAP